MEFGTLRRRLLVVILSLFGAFANAHFPTDITYLLPKNFKPISYTLNITTHLEDKFVFEGVVKIRIVCLVAFDIIVLHAKELNINAKRVAIVDSAGKSVDVQNVWFAPYLDRMYVSSARGFKPDEEFVLSIPFAGNITRSLTGYYRSSYVDRRTNQTKWLAVTKFEPVDARRAFPCFDEPELKATFKINLHHHKDLVSLSNTKLIETTPDPSIPNFVVDEYEESVPLSTYKVAYMVSDFVCNDFSEVPKVHLRVFSRRDAIELTDYPRFTALVILKHFENYFDMKCPSTKLDMVAVPDFASTAMENLGLITFSESTLLLDSRVATIGDSHRVAQVVTHELAHIWFGSIITMRWWSDLWLNEGFAKYFTYRAMDKLYPTWKTYQMETAENFITVLDLDTRVSSHAVSMNVSKPREISQLFDPITYDKGAYLLHMTCLFLGEKVFRLGIRNYIKKHKYSNATQDDFWNALTEVAHEKRKLPDRMTMKEIMGPWTLQAGYPVVTAYRDFTTGTVTFAQSRYLPSDSGNESSNASCWWVPFTMTTSSELDFSRPSPHTWLNCESKENTMKLNNNVTWLIINIQMSGLYRVLYDVGNWWALSAALNDRKKYKKIHVLNRAQLIDDALTFAWYDHLHYALTFQLVSYLKHEHEYVPWMVAARGLSPIDRVLKRTGNYGIFTAYMRGILTPLFDKYSEQEGAIIDFEEIRLKNLVFSQACYYKHKNCTDYAKDLFYKWAESNDSDAKHKLPRELKSTIYCQAARHGGEEVWDFLWKRYESSESAAEKSKILTALGCTTDAYLLHRYLNWTIGENAIIRKQDAFLVFQSVANNDLGYFLARDFLFLKIKEISKYFHPREDLVGRYLEVIGSNMKEKKELNKFQKLVDENKPYLKGTEITVNRTIETLKSNIKWTSKFYKKLTLFETFFKV